MVDLPGSCCPCLAQAGAMRNNEGGLLGRITMSRTCTICRHEERLVIEEELLRGEPHRRIAARFHVAATSVRRHREHVLQDLREMDEVKQLSRSGSLVDYVRELGQRTEVLYQEATNLLKQAKESKDLKGALAAIREAAIVSRECRGNAALLGELTGEIRHNAGAVTGVMIVMPTVIAPADPAERCPVY